MRDSQRDSLSSLPTTHSEKQGRRMRRRRRGRRRGEKKKSSGKVPVTFPCAASSHHPPGVFPHISFHFYILLPPVLLSHGFPAFIPPSTPPSFPLASSTRGRGVCTSAWLIITALAALQTYSSHSPTCFILHGAVSD